MLGDLKETLCAHITEMTLSLESFKEPAREGAELGMGSGQNPLVHIERRIRVI